MRMAAQAASCSADDWPWTSRAACAATGLIVAVRELGSLAIGRDVRPASQGVPQTGGAQPVARGAQTEASATHASTPSSASGRMTHTLG